MIIINEKRKRAASATIFLIFLLSLLSGCVEKSDSDNGEDFEFALLDGTVKHLSDYRGKIVILDMWASWCSPCAYQMAELRTAYDTYDRNELEIISLNIDPRENNDVINQYVSDYKSQLGVDLDWIFGQDNGSVWAEYMIGQGGIPTLYIFNQEGIIHFSHEGLTFFSEVPDTFPDSPTLALKINELI